MKSDCGICLLRFLLLWMRGGGVVVAILTLCTAGVFAQAPPVYDAIRLKDDATIEGRILSVEGDSVSYRLLDLPTEYRIAKSRVREIVYADGRVVPMVEETSVDSSRRMTTWRNVEVTRNPDDVKGMLLVDTYDLSLQATNKYRMKVADLETGAIIQLRQRAIQKRCTYLLIKEVHVMTSYGEPPTVRIVGEAYRKLAR